MQVLIFHLQAQYALRTYVADRASQKEFGLTSSTYCVFFVWLQARALSVSFLLPSVQHDLFCHVHVEAAALPRLMHSLH